MDVRGFLFTRYRRLNKKLVFVFMISLLVPLLATTYIVANRYIDKYSMDVSRLIDNTLLSSSQNINEYLAGLDQLTLTPYYDDDFIYALKMKSTDTSDSVNHVAILEIMNRLESQLKFIRNTRKDIMSTLIVSQDKPIFYFSNNPQAGIVEHYSFKETSWYQAAIKAQGRAVLVEPHKQDYFTQSTSDISVFSVARAVMDLKTQRPICVILADANTIALEKIFRELDFHVSSNIALLDQERHLIYSKKPITGSLIQAADADRSIVRGEEDSYFVIKKKIPPYGLELLVFLSYSELKNKSLWIYINSILLYIVCVAAALVFYQLLSRKVTGPIHEIIKTMRKIEQGDFDARYRGKTKDEFEIIGHSLNSMITELKQKIDREYELVYKQRNSEYKALQSQIQPHFLFNMLNGFIALNQMGEKELLEKSIIDLTVMLRYILSDLDWPKLEEEVGFLRNYCTLQKLRFGSRLHFSIRSDVDLSAYRIPKLLLQPIVENAIIHGIEPLNKPCFLNLRITRMSVSERAVIRIVIEDTGIGFHPQQLEAGNHIGIANIRDRLKLCYKGSTFHLESEPMKGTRVTIEIPEEEMTA